MMPRKTRITVTAISVIGVISLIVLISVMIMFTDMFMSNKKLFGKYVIQNMKIFDTIQFDDESGIENTLASSKYESDFKTNIEYTENIGTSDENNNHDINNINLDVKSNVDKANDFRYRDITLSSDDEKLMRTEYIKDADDVAVRLDGIKQFVVFDGDDDQIVKMSNIDDISELYNIISKLSLNDLEKQKIQTTYSKILFDNISNDKYSKKSGIVITVNDKNVDTKAYSMKITIEEFNNLIIKILEQLEQDEVIINKLETLENDIRTNYPSTNYKIKENFVEKIEKKIEDIQNNNIGNEEVIITVNVSKKKLIRTSIEKSTESFIIDFLNDTSVKFNKIKRGDITDETSTLIEKKNNSYSLDYTKTSNDEMTNNITLEYSPSMNGDNITKNLTLGVASERFKMVFSVVDEIKLVNEFENEVTLENDTVRLSDLDNGGVENIQSILSRNIQEQLYNLTDIISLQDAVVILKNLDVLNVDLVAFPEEGEVTDIQKQRFNAQFEFFESEGLSKDNITELLNISKKHLEDIKVALKTGEIEKIDIEKLESSEKNEYLDSISEIIIYIKEDSKNEEVLSDTLDLLEDINEKFDVTIQYANNGLVNTIRAKIQERE